MQSLTTSQKKKDLIIKQLGVRAIKHVLQKSQCMNNVGSRLVGMNFKEKVVLKRNEVPSQY